LRHGVSICDGMPVFHNNFWQEFGS
jgi:hypothetical protein